MFSRVFPVMKTKQNETKNKTKQNNSRTPSGSNVKDIKPSKYVVLACGVNKHEEGNGPRGQNISIIIQMRNVITLR